MWGFRLQQAAGRRHHRNGHVGGRGRLFPPGAALRQLVFLTLRQLYGLCQMFPESASKSVRFVLRDAMHEMEGMIEAKGRAVFPGLDVVSWLSTPPPLYRPLAPAAHAGQGELGGLGVCQWSTEMCWRSWFGCLRAGPGLLFMAQGF